MKDYDSAVYRTVGKAIRERRKQLGMTQEELAGRVCIARASVANIEGGKQRVSIELLYSIGRELQHEPREFLPKQSELHAPGSVPKAAQKVLEGPEEVSWFEKITAYSADEDE